MGFLATLLSGVGTWFMKILLGGLFGSINQQLEDELKHQGEAAHEHETSIVVSNQVETDIVAAQHKIEDKKPIPTETDPFDNSGWNN